MTTSILRKSTLKRSLWSGQDDVTVSKLHPPKQSQPFQIFLTNFFLLAVLTPGIFRLPSFCRLLFPFKASTRCSYKLVLWCRHLVQNLAGLLLIFWASTVFFSVCLRVSVSANRTPGRFSAPAGSMFYRGWDICDPWNGLYTYFCVFHLW